MRIIGFVSVAALLALSVPAWADDASKTAKIDEIFQITKVDATITAIRTQVRDMQADTISKMALSPEQKERALDVQKQANVLIFEQLNWDKFKGPFTKLYLELFSEEELSGMLAFYKSDAGRAMLDKMPLLMSRSMAIAQQAVQDIMPELQKLHSQIGEKK